MDLSLSLVCEVSDFVSAVNSVQEQGWHLLSTFDICSQSLYAVLNYSTTSDLLVLTVI